MKVLVTGGAGYVGSLMSSKLHDAQHDVVVFDNLSTGKKKALPKSVTFYEGDIGDEKILNDIFQKESIEIVMHFAAKIQVGESVRKPDLYYRNNVAKVLHLLKTMLQHNCKKFIFSSTAAVYGEPQYLPIDEQHPVNPINPYGSSKLMLESILADYHKAFNMDCIILRYFNAAGAAIDGSVGEVQIKKQNLIPIVLDNFEHNRTTSIFGADWNTEDGSCIRDYIHIEDIVEAHAKAMEYLSRKNIFEIINLGSNSGVSVKEVISIISKITGRKIDTKENPRRRGDAAQLIASNEKAKRILGWKPVNSNIKDIIRSAYRWHFNRKY